MLGEVIEAIEKEGLCFPGEDIKPLIVYDRHENIIRDYEPYYEITTFGRIWSIKKGSGKWLKFKTDKNGYLRVSLPDEKKIEKEFGVHRLVLFTFVGPPDTFYSEECRHLDGNPANNHLDNLCWDTRLKNCEDRKLHGISYLGSNNPSVSLTEEKVLEIRRLYKTGTYSARTLGKKFDVTHTTVLHIVNRLTWVHI